MKITLHQTHHTIGDFQSIFAYLKDYFSKDYASGLHLFPENFLTGYPLQDLCLQKPFIISYNQFLADLNDWAQDQLKPTTEDSCILMGGLIYELDEDGLPAKIENTIYKVIPGEKITPIYNKRLLPNYDIFDEQKYFSPGDKTEVLNFADKTIGLLICEDMWPSSTHKENPVEDLAKGQINGDYKLDLVINLSASPFHLGKPHKRFHRAKEISKLLGVPFAYVNRVGGEDEILFDGNSFYCDGQEISQNLASFAKECATFEYTNKSGGTPTKSGDDRPENTWESLFEVSWQQASPPTLTPWTDEDCHAVLEALKFGLSEYANKCGFEKYLVALSGGIDSAVVLAIAHLLVKDPTKIEAIYMPGMYSAGLSHDLAYEMCQNLGIKLKTLPIKFLHSAVRNATRETFGEELEGLANENIQSRLRGSLLYARSNQTGAMVINTSNKSELAVGYSTMYGDSVGAVSLLGDVFKVQVYQLANYINEHFGNLIPAGIINREPSAELRENQTDSQTLPPYERLDPLLEGILSYRLHIEDLVQAGFDREEVIKIYGLFEKSEYKRRQFCPIIKVDAKSFGFGYRVPICKKIRN